MFLHLGENVVVPIKDVIGIFDLQHQCIVQIQYHF